MSLLSATCSGPPISPRGLPSPVTEVARKPSRRRSSSNFMRHRRGGGHQQGGGNDQIQLIRSGGPEAGFRDGSHNAVRQQKERGSTLRPALACCCHDAEQKQERGQQEDADQTLVDEHTDPTAVNRQPIEALIGETRTEYLFDQRPWSVEDSGPDLGPSGEVTDLLSALPA